MFGRSQLKPCSDRDCGLAAAAPAGVNWTRMRIVRGQGLAVIAACLLSVRVRCFAALVVVRDSYRVAVCRIHRDCFADAETCLPAGVRHALS